MVTTSLSGKFIERNCSSYVPTCIRKIGENVKNRIKGIYKVSLLLYRGERISSLDLLVPNVY